MGFGFVAIGYILALILTAFLIFFAIYHIIAFDELKTDYKNPIDQCNSLNPLVLPEYAIHAFFTFVFLLAAQFGSVLFNVPLIAYHVHRYANRPVMSSPGLYDPTSIMNADQLNKAMREGWIKLAFYLISFFYYLYSNGALRMSLICAISNEVPEHPVLSPVSGHIYERRLAEKFINESGTDPMSGENLTIEQLIEVKAPPLVKPKPPSATSIPAILKSLQDEWDAVMLHSFTLRQQLQTARQELSHTLYQHDAACRVIARLTKEVTAAREALATLKPQAGVMNPAGGPTAVPIVQPPPPGTTPSMEDTTGVSQLAEVVGMSEEVVTRLQETATRLTAERKKRGKQPPEGLVSSDEVRNLHQKASHVGLHSASIPGILCLDACQHDTNKVITGGNDKNAVVFNKETEQIVAVLRGHSKKVTSVVYHPREELAFTGSPDATIRVWGVQKAACAFVLRAHEAAVTGLSLHATGDYLLSASADAHWALSDIRVGRVLLKVADQQKTQALTCAQFHPDGLILGTGTEEAEVKIWDLKDRNNVANFSSHEGPITAMHFSENGYYLATAATDGVVKLWDLRKLKNFKTITPSDDRRYEIKEVCFDQSGSYLAIAGSDVRVYLCKQWSELVVINDHTAMCTGVRFGSMARSIISCSMDRSVKVFTV